MANYKSGAERRNDRMDKIFDRAKYLQGEYFGRSNLSPSEIVKYKKHVSGQIAKEQKSKIASKMKKGYGGKSMSVLKDAYHKEFNKDMPSHLRKEKLI